MESIDLVSWHLILSLLIFHAWALLLELPTLLNIEKVLAHRFKEASASHLVVSCSNFQSSHIPRVFVSVSPDPQGNWGAQWNWKSNLVPNITRWMWAQLCQCMQQLNQNHHHRCGVLSHGPGPMNSEHPASPKTGDNLSATGVSDRPAAHSGEEADHEWITPNSPWRCWETPGFKDALIKMLWSRCSARLLEMWGYLGSYPSVC